MYEVIGIQASKFKFKDQDKEIVGTTLYLTEERKYVTGLACERLFLTAEKMDGYTPAVGDLVDVHYNRFGKPQAINLIK